MLINISNHPRSTWSSKQREEANRQFGEIVDYPFPFVAPESPIEEVKSLAENIYQDIIQTYPMQDLYLHIMGEHSLVYQLVQLFEKKGYKCVLSTSDRKVEDLPGGGKKVYFDFVAFRGYY